MRSLVRAPSGTALNAALAAGLSLEVAGQTRDMGDCRNYGPFLGTLNTRCRIIIGIQKGTIILTTTHIFGLGFRVWGLGLRGGASKGKETWKLDEQWAYIAVQCGFQG